MKNKLIKQADINKVIEFNPQAVALGLQINPFKDINSLHIGYLNLLYLVFERSQDQCHLDMISTYIMKYLNVNPLRESKDTGAILEVLGMQLIGPSIKSKSQPDNEAVIMKKYQA